MTPVKPEELSGLIDGALLSERARQVEAQIAADPALKRDYEALCALDCRCRDAGREAGFAVQVHLPVATSPGRYLVTGLVIAALLGVRAGARLIDPWSIALGLQGAVLLGILIWLSSAVRARASVIPNPSDF